MDDVRPLVLSGAHNNFFCCGSSTSICQRPYSGKPVEIRREDGSILVLDSD